MNKRKVDRMIPEAYKLLDELKIMGSDAKTNRKWRGQIASFGAAIAQGSLKAAVSLFSAQNGKEVNTAKLMEAIAKLINCKGTLFQYVCDTKERTAKEEILSAAVALKLAMNLYDLGKGDEKDAGSQQDESQLSSE